jgi:hypothetical protein
MPETTPLNLGIVAQSLTFGATLVVLTHLTQAGTLNRLQKKPLRLYQVGNPKMFGSQMRYMNKTHRRSGERKARTTDWRRASIVLIESSKHAVFCFHQNPNDFHHRD